MVISANASLNDSNSPSFEEERTTHVPDSSDFVLNEWDSFRDSGISPRFQSTLGGSVESRNEFLRGLTLLRRYGDRAIRGSALHAQMLRFSDLLDAGHPNNAVLFPRRSAKTTSAIAVGLGRAEAREDYRVAVGTLTTGKAGRSRFLRDVAPALERLYPDKATRPFHIYRGAGQERVEFPNGGFMVWLSTEDDLRGEAFDLVFLDEAGEPDPASVEEWLAAALPVTDTRPDAQLVVLGTGPRYRSGNLLWDWLERGRAGGLGILEYSNDQDLSVDQIDSWETVEPLVLDSHPGVGGLTTVENIKANFEAMTRENFLREYLGVATQIGGTSFLNQVRWKAGEQEGDKPQPPAQFSLCFAVHPEQTSASLVAAWRDKGKAHVLVLDHRPNVAWLYARALELARKYKVPLVYDSGASHNIVQAEKLGKARPKPKLEGQNWSQVATAASLFTTEVDSGNVVHWGQDPLNEAVAKATKRGTRESKRWAFGRPAATDDITALEAASLALRYFDELKPRVPVRIVTAA